MGRKFEDTHADRTANTQNGWLTTLERIIDHDDRAVVILTPECFIVYANAAGKDLVFAGNGFRTQAGFLEMSSHEETCTLRRMILAMSMAHNNPGTSHFLLPVRNSSGEISHLVKAWLLPCRVGPIGKIGPLIQLTIESVQQPVRLTSEIMRLFGLSRREFDMAESLCSHETINDAANRLGISLETARGYVKALLAKLGVSSQKDAALVLTHFIGKSD